MLKRWMFSFLALVALALHGAYTGKIELDKPDGFYKSGETATCTVQILKNGKPLVGEKVFFLIRWENRNVRSGTFVSDGKPRTFSYRSDKPGWVYFGFQVLGKDGKPLRGKGVDKHRYIARVTEIGAMFDADKIRYTVKPPADFAEFWEARKAEVAACDLKPELTEINSGIRGIKLFAVKLSCPRGIAATGYLAYPANAAPKSLPACLSYLSWTNTDASRRSALRHAKLGAIAFATTWHGLPVGHKAKYYADILKPRVKGGITDVADREKWVMGEIYFRVMCELKFLKSRPQWNGRDLISIGGSLGGAQSSIAAALDKDVTLAVINVPCFCEFDGASVGRRGSLPRHDVAKTPAALAEQNYFDCVHFAPMIRCETYVCTGFSDECCHPSSVYAFYNAIPEGTKKVITTDPRTGHYGTTVNKGGNARFQALFDEVKVGAVPAEVK